MAAGGKGESESWERAGLVRKPLDAVDGQPNVMRMISECGGFSKAEE